MAEFDYNPILSTENYRSDIQCPECGGHITAEWDTDSGYERPGVYIKRCPHCHVPLFIDVSITYKVRKANVK